MGLGVLDDESASIRGARKNEDDFPQLRWHTLGGRCGSSSLHCKSVRSVQVSVRARRFLKRSALQVTVEDFFVVVAVIARQQE